MLTSQNQRVIPTSEELKLLREKLSNLKDLHIYKNSSKNISQTNPVMNTPGVSRNDRLQSDKHTTSRYMFMKSSTTTKLVMKENNLNSNKSNQSLPEKELELQKYNEVQNFLELNKDKIERVEKYDELLKENEFLKAELEKNQFADGSQTFADVLEDYTRMKSENISLKRQLDESEQHLIKIEKENKILRDIDSNTLNKNHLKYFIISLLSQNYKRTFENETQTKMLTELFGNNSMDLIQYLTQRIDSLEIQNFQLITKMEKLTHTLKNYLVELVEYSDVISDIRNVLNIVYDSQTLTTEFLIIRETLNSRRNYIQSQKDSFLEEKEKLDRDNIKDRNMDVLLCRDKIVESKVNITNNPVKTQNKIFDVLDEKIEIYENLKNNLAQYEDYMNRKKEDQDQDPNQNLYVAENLMNENYILKSKNIRLQDLIVKLLRNKKEMDDETVGELNDITNTQRDIILSEDLFNMVKAQALIIENISLG